MCLVFMNKKEEHGVSIDILCGQAKMMQAIFGQSIIGKTKKDWI